MSCALLNWGLRFKAGTAGYSPWCLCPCCGVKTGPDHTLQGWRELVLQHQHCCALDLAVASNTAAWGHCFSVTGECCGLFGCSSLFRVREAVLFAAWRIEGKAMYRLLLPEDITHLIFFCLGWEGEAGWIKSLLIPHPLTTSVSTWLNLACRNSWN